MALNHGHGLGQHVQPATQPSYSNDGIKAALRQAAAALGRTPTRADYDTWRSALPETQGLPSGSRCGDRFGSWVAALTAAGLTARPDQLNRAKPRTTPPSRDRVNWTSDGCEWFASCFTCPLTKGCRYDYLSPAEAEREAEECEGYLWPKRVELTSVEPCDE